MPDHPHRHLISLLDTRDRPGLVAQTSAYIHDNGGNIVDADQHTDHEAGVFFQRIVWSPAEFETTGDLTKAAAAFDRFAADEGMRATTALARERPRVVVFVSKYAHCFHDFLLRWQAGEMPGEVVAIVSNHPDLEDAARFYRVPFHVVKVNKANKAAAEARQLSILRHYQADVVLLARYMQVLSADLLEQFGRPIINIHHSFLPAFAGARPYHQAHTRGVKLIGATAHYVTPVLDEGPIIHQAVTPVSHRDTVADLVRKGQDLEKMVFSEAARWHLEHRVLQYRQKTVVFA